MKRRKFIKTISAVSVATPLVLTSKGSSPKSESKKMNMVVNDFDTIVIGVGSMGSSTCYHLAKRGYKVLGLEQFDIPHQKGSHSGHSRIIRKAYFEHPDYVPLLQSAYKNWEEFEQLANTQLYFPTGFVYFGLAESDLISGVRKSSAKYGIPLSEFNDKADIKSQFPQFSIPSHYDTVFEEEAGFIMPEQSILSYVNEARKLGAVINTNESVKKWEKDGSGVKVTTNKATYLAQKLVITAGPWASHMIPQLSKKLETTQQFLAWVKPKSEAEFKLDKFPCWTIADENTPGIFYGFPIMPEPGHFGEMGLKIAHHNPGTVIDPNANETFNEQEEMDKLESILRKYMPNSFDKFISLKSCKYTNTPDGDFVIDQLPGYEDRVTIGCGFSGHGFKFVSVVGEILTDLAIDSKTKHPIGFLSTSRFF